MKVISILVLYNPNMILLKENIYSVLQQVDYLYISDNTPGRTVGLDEIIRGYENVLYQSMEGNVGIAKAQNYGIKFAIENKFDYIFSIRTV